MASVRGSRRLSSRPLPFFGIDGDLSVHLLDVRLDHVHTDAPAGNAAHLLGSAETRDEDEVHCVAGREGVELVLPDQSLFSGLLLHGFDVYALSIVKYLYDYIVAFVVCLQ